MLHRRIQRLDLVIVWGICLPPLQTTQHRDLLVSCVYISHGLLFQSAATLFCAFSSCRLSRYESKYFGIILQKKDWHGAFGAHLCCRCIMFPGKHGGSCHMSSSVCSTPLLGDQRDGRGRGEQGENRGLGGGGGGQEIRRCFTGSWCSPKKGLLLRR